jgi:hypothetical protein
MQLVQLPLYEHEKGIPLEKVAAYECPSCHEWAFTEQQVEDVERRTEVAKAHRFGFMRKITVSGRSLVLNLPDDLVKHMKLSKGGSVRIVPLDDRHLVVEIG